MNTSIESVTGSLTKLWKKWHPRDNEAVDTDVCRRHNGQSKKSQHYSVYSAVTAVRHVEIQNYIPKMHSSRFISCAYQSFWIFYDVQNVCTLHAINVSLDYFPKTWKVSEATGKDTRLPTIICINCAFSRYEKPFRTTRPVIIKL